jgi:hypothetical protein
MADDAEAIAISGADGDGAAESLALAGASRAKADAYLEEQTGLARLQKQNLIEQNAFELSHLRFRRFSDYARFALEVAGFLVVLLVVCGLATMVWSAVRDRDLVVDAFQVPADVAQSGLTGSVLAGHVLDKLGRMQASTLSMAQGAGSYRANDGDQIRVEIPTTGISIGELDRYLRQWLGHETRVSGDLVRTPKGYALTVRYGSQPGTTVAGDNLDTLAGEAAERLYAAARPLRYADYLAARGRYAEAAAIVVPLAGRGSAQDRAQAYVAWATLLYQQGDVQGQFEKSELATRLDPSNAAAWDELDAGAFNTGHREKALQAEETVLSLIRQGKAADLNPDMAQTLPITIAADLAMDKGAPQEAAVACQKALDANILTDCTTTFLSDYELRGHNVGEARRISALIPAKDSEGRDAPESVGALSKLTVEAEDWPAALAFTKKEDELLAKLPNELWRQHRQLWPNLAYIMVRDGDFPGGEALIAKTPLDCDNCLMMRGRIAAVVRDWKAAERWFSLASARMPSIPYCDAHWGEMLMAKGDFDGAIAKFESAHAKGPHFADPLEMWGEALIAGNRSDLALAKFEEANKYAPNWGRLHLKWGEALWWSGRRSDARKQFETAAQLDLSAAEHASLRRNEAL